MSDYISRADAIEAVCRDCTIERKDKCKAEGYCYEVQNLKALPSADAVSREEYYDLKHYTNVLYNHGLIQEEQYRNCVQVIHCADCRHIEVINSNEIYAVCNKFGYQFLPFEDDTRTHFCSWGEMKGGDDE